VTKYAPDCEQVLLGVVTQIEALLRRSQGESIECPSPTSRSDDTGSASMVLLSKICKHIVRSTGDLNGAIFASFVAYQVSCVPRTTEALPCTRYEA